MMQSTSKKKDKRTRKSAGFVIERNWRRRKEGKNMIVLAIALIITLVSVEIYCGWWLYGYIKERSEQRTSARRAAYRYKAYREMNERYNLKQSREKLWRSVLK